MRRRRRWVEAARGRADADREVETSERVEEGGTYRRRLAREAWRVGHEIARALNVTPWEALLGEVRRTAGGVAWLDRKVAEAPTDEALLRTHDAVDPDTGEVRERAYAGWVKLRMQERQHLARVAKMAVDAGVAQELVAQFALQGETYARLLTAVITRLGLDEEREALATELMREQLLQLEATATSDRVVEGETVEIEERTRR